MIFLFCGVYVDNHVVALKSLFSDGDAEIFGKKYPFAGIVYYVPIATSIALPLGYRKLGH